MTQGTTLGRYKVLHELGRGATGAVYAARDRSTGLVIALKRIDPALLNKPDAKVAGLFLKEARSAWRLKHRNIVKIHEAAEANGTAYVAMELLEGESLRDLLHDRPLSVARAIRIAEDLARGLAYAHEAGVIHRGLKPSNIFVLRSGGVKISDFGIGRLAEADLLSGERAGCLSYLSPEQVRGDPVDHRSDLFSLGAVFYEMLTRHSPFEGDSPKKVVENILHAELPLPSELNAHVPRALDGIVSSMLARQPETRMPGAPILLRDLQRLEEELGLASGGNADIEEPASSVPPTAREPGLRRPAQTEPAAPQAAPPEPDAAPEPRLRMPEADELRDRAPMRDAPRFERFDEREAISTMDRESGSQRSSGSRSGIFAGLALVLSLLAIGLTVAFHFSPGLSQRLTAATRMQEMREAPVTAAAPSRPAAPPPAVEAAKEPATPPAAPVTTPPVATVATPPAAETSPAAPVASPRRAEAEAPKPSPLPETVRLPPRPLEQSAAGGTSPARKLPRATQSIADVPKQQAGGMAKVIIAVSPKGEIYIDGRHYGTTPPITTLDLEPGMHRIEVQSGSRKPYLTYMTVQAGDVRRIQHDFGTKPSVRVPGSAS